MHRLLPLILALFLFPQVCWGGASTTFNSSDQITVASGLISGWPVTFSTWVKPLSGNNDLKAICGLADASQGNIQYYLMIRETTGVSRMWWRNTSIFASDGSTDLRGAWTFLTLIARSNTDRELYESAVSAATDADSVAFSGDTDRFTIGEFGDSSPSNSFRGEIAYVHVHSKDMPVWEMTQLRWLPGSSTGTLEGLWMLWGDSSEKDHSGNGNNGSPGGVTISVDGPPVMFGGGLPL